MKKLLNNPFLPRTSVFSLVCSLMMCNAAYAQTCSDGVCTGNFTLDSLEAITEDIRNATKIVGNLTIGDGSTGTDLTNAHLATLQVDTITGDLRIEQTRLTTLNAFSSLKHVGGNLWIGYVGNRGNSVLRSVSGFNALRSVTSTLYVWSNADLETVNGFDMLETVGGELGLYENNELSSISGFGSLRNVGGALTFENNPLLTSLPDFPSLTGAYRISLLDIPMLGTLPSFDRLETIRQNFGITNIAVTSISGFPALTTIGGNLSIDLNSRLRSVSGFPSLTTIGGLIIGGGAGGNLMLETLSGFPALRNIGASDGSSIVISGNRMFASCCVAFPFVQTPLPPGYTVGGSGPPTISDNASGCSSEAEIRATTGCPFCDKHRSEARFARGDHRLPSELRRGSRAISRSATMATTTEALRSRTPRSRGYKWTQLQGT